MISQRIRKMLNEQINKELWSAYLYLSMSLYAGSINMEGMAHWLYIQCKEELDHSRRLQTYMVSQGVKVELTSIGEVPQSWPNLQSLFEDVADQERKVTRMIHDMMDAVCEERDYATMSMLKWFVDEQVEEEEQSNAIVAKLRCFDDNVCAIYSLDREMMKREL